MAPALRGVRHIRRADVAAAREACRQELTIETDFRRSHSTAERRPLFKADVGDLGVGRQVRFGTRRWTLKVD
jgi:hypothetical protein